MNSQETMTISIKPFGAMRQYAASPITVTLATNQTVAAIKTALCEQIKSKHPDSDIEQLIKSSALADNQNILDDNNRLTESVELAILPPVCGG